MQRIGEDGFLVPMEEKESERLEGGTDSCQDAQDGGGGRDRRETVSRRSFAYALFEPFLPSLAAGVLRQYPSAVGQVQMADVAILGVDFV